MSEFSETYHIQIPDRREVARFLREAGHGGFVFPSDKGWTTFVVERDFPGPVEDVLRKSPVLLLYLLVNAQGDWYFAAWDNGYCIAEMCHAMTGDSPADASVQDDTTLQHLSDKLRLDAEKASELRDALCSSQSTFEQGKHPVDRLAEIVGLSHYWGESYDDILRDEDDFSERDVYAVDADPDGENSSDRFIIKMNHRSANSDTFRLPAALFGDAKSVSREWGKVTRRVWKEGTWDVVDTELESIPIQTLGKEVYVASATFDPPNSEHTWRTYLVGELLEKQCMKNHTEGSSDDVEYFDKLLVSGMDRFWFVLGLLQTGGGGFYLPAWKRSNYTVPELEEQLATKFVSWFHEFEKIIPVLRFPGCQQPPQEPKCGYWAISMYQVLCWSGRTIPIQEIIDSYQGDILRAYTESEYVVLENGRYRLKEKRR